MPHLQKAKTYPDESKGIFQKPKILLAQLKEGFRVSSLKTLKLVIPDTRPWL